MASSTASRALQAWMCGAGAFAVGAGAWGAGPPLLAWGLAGAAALAGAGLALRRRVLLWAAAAGSAACGVTLLMDLLQLAFGQGVDSVPGAVLHLLGLAGAVLSAGAAGGPPKATGPAGRWVPYVGTLCFVPYVAMKTTWALGGTFGGLTGAQVLAASERNGASGLWLTLERWGVDATVLMAAAGVALLFALLRRQPWPRWMPRSVLLVPAVVGAATLVPYGLLGMGYLALMQAGVITPVLGDFDTAGDMTLVGWIGNMAFAGYGVALAAATRAHWSRSR